MKKLYYTTDKFHNANRVPYEENSKHWHIWLDVAFVTDNVPGILDISTMINANGTNWEYYDLDIDVLVKDGYLETRNFEDAK